MSYRTPQMCVMVRICTTGIRLPNMIMTQGECVQPLQCQTVMTVVLTVMSGMDPHMISGRLGWVWFGWVWSGQFYWLGQSSTVDSVV
jgi:hypothetical protein